MKKCGHFCICALSFGCTLYLLVKKVKFITVGTTWLDTLATKNHVFEIKIAVTNIGHEPKVDYTVLLLYTNYCSIHCINPAFAVTQNKPL